MKARAAIVVLMLGLCTSTIRADSFVSPGAQTAPGFWQRVETVIQKLLKRPYVWGSAGLKSFDCSGFVWRVMYENKILVKRSTARKYYLCLPRVRDDARWNAANIVFFDDLKHCGIVRDARSFYHASVTAGTTLSEFDPYWRNKISGIRGMPARESR